MQAWCAARLALARIEALLGRRIFKVVCGPPQLEDEHLDTLLNPASVHLTSIDCILALRDVYARVSTDAPNP